MNAKLAALHAKKSALMASRPTKELINDLKVLEKLDDECVETSIKTQTRLWMIEEIEGRHPEIDQTVTDLFIDDDGVNHPYSFYLEQGLKKHGVI